MMIFNAELRRNIWLNFTSQRLILTPLIIGLIIYLTYSMSGIEKSSGVAFILACFFIFLWGTKDASDTVIEEINNSTWDFQRQSTISPWSMAWGKLIGSTLFSWYGAAICLILYAFLNSHMSTISLTQKILTLILGGIFSQALALLLSLQVLPLIRSQKNNKSFRYFFAGTLIGIIFTYYIFHELKQDTILWHGYTFSATVFSIFSLVIFIGWCAIGLQRSFSKELQYQKTPWIWALFTLFCVIYFSGFEIALGSFSTNENINVLVKNLPSFIAFLVAVALTYIALFTDTLNTVRYKKLFLRLSEKNFFEAALQLPWWPISFLVAMVTGLFAIKGLIDIKEINSNLIENFSPATYIFTSLLFIVRDILLAHFVFFGNNSKRNLSTIALYLFIAYFLIPLLFSVLKWNNLSHIFTPSYGQNTPLALGSLFIQIGLLGWLCWKRYHQSWTATH